MIDVTACNPEGLSRSFAWLTRNGMGRHLGSVSIHWYQIHQCKALDVIAERANNLGADPTRVKVVKGLVQARKGDRMVCLGLSCSDVFKRADKLARE